MRTNRLISLLSVLGLACFAFGDVDGKPPTATDGPQSVMSDSPQSPAAVRSEKPRESPSRDPRAAPLGKQQTQQPLAAPRRTRGMDQEQLPKANAIEYIDVDPPNWAERAHGSRVSKREDTAGKAKPDYAAAVVADIKRALGKAAKQGGADIYPPPIYNPWDDFQEGWGSSDCSNGLMAPQMWLPPPECGPLGGCTYCWLAFPTLYYQDQLLCAGTVAAVEAAPLTFGDFNVAYDSGAPAAPSYYGRFEAFEGLDCLKNIPLECTKTVQPVVASARYWIDVGGSNSGAPPSTYAGALFYVTAVYDDSLFDVHVSGWIRTHYGSSYDWDYQKRLLPSFSTYMFQGETPDIIPSTLQFKQNEWRRVPDYVQVKLKDGRGLDELQGRTVRLFLHTLRWSGDGDGCPVPWDGDRIDFKRTDTLDVGICADAAMEDWYITPPPLATECAAPNLPETTQKAARIQATGVKVVNDTNVALPTMRVGHNRWKAGRTLGETLGNRACWHAFGPGPGNDFLRVNVFGVWFAAEDVPGWEGWYFASDGQSDYLFVPDPCANVRYDFFTTDTGETPGAITWEDYMFNDGTRLLGVYDQAAGAQQRYFDYQSSDIAQNLVSQRHPDNGCRVDYTYQTLTGDRLRLTATGTAPDGTRAAVTEFDPEAVVGESGTRPLTQATISGSGASHVYEWYPISDPPTQRDRRLKKVSDITGQVLAEYAYDDQGRLISHTRGTAAMGNLQTVAEFLYEEPENPEDPYIMESCFWVDGANHQVAVRTFDKQNQVVQLAEYHNLVNTVARACCMSDQSCQDLSREDCLAQDGTPQFPGSACDGFDCTNPPAGDVSVTASDFHIPDDDVNPGQHDPFYHQVCTINSEQVVLTRCVEKTTPRGDMSEYVFFDCDFNAVESYMGPSDITGPPPQPKSHLTRTYDRQPGWGVTQTTRECDVSRNACSDITYDPDGYMTRRDEPLVTVGVNTGFQAYRTIHYDGKHRIDYETRNDGTGTAITLDYGYDTYGYVNRRTENPGAGQIEQLFVNSAFGQETQRTDPDGYVRKREYNSAGLLTKTYTYASGASGLVIKQTNYLYADGRLSTLRVADHDGPFTKDSPPAWVTTTYQYDDYGRVTLKTVAPGGHTTTYEYDIQDRIRKITYPDGIWKETIRDGRGLIVETRIGPDPILVSNYEYDLNGNLDRRICQGCPDCTHDTVYEYDEYNRRTAEIRKD